MPQGPRTEIHPGNFHLTRSGPRQSPGSRGPVPAFSKRRVPHDIRRDPAQVTGGFSLQALSLENILRTVFILIIGVVAIKLIQRAVERILSRNSALAPVHRYLRSALSIVLWLLLALVLLGSIGVELTSIIALLSVAGLAVSLALQNTLSNLAGGIMLLVSKPFTIGDYVEIGAVSGTVTMIGLSYSTLATVENKEVYIPNSQLSSATIINYTRLGRRRMRSPSAPLTATRRRM